MNFRTSIYINSIKPKTVKYSHDAREPPFVLVKEAPIYAKAVFGLQSENCRTNICFVINCILSFGFFLFFFLIVDDWWRNVPSNSEGYSSRNDVSSSCS